MPPHPRSSRLFSPGLTSDQPAPADHARTHFLFPMSSSLALFPRVSNFSPYPTPFPRARTYSMSSVLHHYNNNYNNNIIIINNNYYYNNCCCYYYYYYYCCCCCCCCFCCCYCYYFYYFCYCYCYCYYYNNYNYGRSRTHALPLSLFDCTKCTECT